RFAGIDRSFLMPTPGQYRAVRRYYNPSQEGSWSIKNLLPAVTGQTYDQLAGVRDGASAMVAYREAIAPETTSARKNELEHQLLAYCKLDTEGMVRIWQFFGNRQ